MSVNDTDRTPVIALFPFSKKNYVHDLISCTFSGTPGPHNLSLSMSMTLTNPAIGKVGSESFTSSWLASDATKHRLEITDLLPGNTMPVNTLDIHGNTLLCGTDGEQIYTINNLNVK